MKSLVIPKHNAANGTEVTDQWYRHQITLGSFSIFINSKVGTPYSTVRDVVTAGLEWGYSGGYALSSYEGGEIVGWSENPYDEYISDIIIYYYSGGSTQIHTKSYRDSNSITDTVTPI